MFHRHILGCSIAIIVISLSGVTQCEAQVQVLSSSPPNVEYQYQMYYPRWYGWPGPGLSLGGSLPTRGREGYSSFYGRPLPVPLGAGVYVNPFAYSTQLPGPMSFGLASTGGSPGAYPPSGGPATPGAYPNGSMPIPQMAGPGAPVPPAPSATSPANLIPAMPKRVSTSSPETIERSREMQSFGDDKLSHQQWTQAYVNYRNAIEIAGDQADAHERLGFACLALKKFPEAAGEFKRAVAIEPATGKSGETLATVFGPESQTMRKEMVRDVANWSREDLKDQDRLFLLGIVLLYNEDGRSQPILEAALRANGESTEQIVALLAPKQASTMLVSSPPVENELQPGPIPEPPDSPKLPELHQQPLALQIRQ